MAKIICDYCEFGTKDKLCYKGGMDKCQGELFVCRQNADTGEKQCNLPVVSPSTLLSDNEEFQKQLLNRWGFTKDGAINCENQLKIFSLLDWLKENQY